jgi:hypothetical protein
LLVEELTLPLDFFVSSLMLTDVEALGADTVAPTLPLADDVPPLPLLGEVFDESDESIITEEFGSRAISFLYSAYVTP